MGPRFRGDEFSMVALKSSEANSFIARPDPARPIVLIYGPDAGLVHERAEALVRVSVDNPADMFSLIRIDGDELSGNPYRLVEEASTVPMFGGRRAIWVKAGSRNIVSAVEAVINAPSPDCRVVIEAGELRKTSPLRTLCEKAKNAVAIACYADDERRHREGDRRRTEEGRARDRARRARGADAVSRRRPSGDARRTAQACALCARPRSHHRRRRDGGGGGCLRGRARQRHRCGLCRQAGRRRIAFRQSARRRHRARRHRRRRRCAICRICIGCGLQSKRVSRSPARWKARDRRSISGENPQSKPRCGPGRRRSFSTR